jgi:hypothetical protein
MKLENNRAFRLWFSTCVTALLLTGNWMNRTVDKAAKANGMKTAMAA